MSVGCVLVTVGMIAAAPVRASSVPSSGGQAAPAMIVLNDPPDRSRQLQSQHEALERRIAEAGEPGEEAALHLALANWLLAEQTAAPATRWLIGVETAEDVRVVAQAAGDARQHIAQARERIETLDDAALTSRLTDAAETLEPFAVLLQALTSRDDADEDAFRSACLTAARSLLIARESPQTDVAAAALLWQAFAYELGGRRDRALVTLPDALARPEGLPHDFLARLLRCRILADAGQYTAASVLTVYISRIKCDIWFRTGSATAREAARLTSALQHRIGRAWLEALKTGETEVADLLAETLREFREDAAVDGFYLLTPAVPIVITAPEPEEAEPVDVEPAGAPTTTEPEEAPAPVIEDDGDEAADSEDEASESDEDEPSDPVEP